MHKLFHFNWKSFDLGAGIKCGLGATAMFVMEWVTGESWLATGLVLMLVWIADLPPGTLKQRLASTLIFMIVAAAFTLLISVIGFELWPNVIAIIIAGFLGTVVVVKGMRPFMLGFALISWVIYAPVIVSVSSVENCLLAILAGGGVLIVLNLIGALFGGEKEVSPPPETAEPDSGPAETGPTLNFILAYSMVVALVLGLTTYLGWSSLKTDPTLAVGAAFYIIGFDAKVTFINGVARMIGIIAGVFLGYMVSLSVESGLLLHLIAIAGFFFCFAMIPVHPGSFMFFFVFVVSLGWAKLDNETLNLSFWERMIGEGAGVVIAMVAIALLQWLQKRQVRL